MHLDLSIQKKNYNLMLTSTDANGSSELMHSISYASLSEVACTNGFQDGVVKMEYPFEFEAGCFVELRSSCNGLVCLVYGDHSTDFILCLWNPATNEFKELPEPPRADSEGRENWNLKSNSYALGYDYKMDDYKLVKVEDRSGGRDGLLTSFYVYTLGSNSWKCIQSIPYEFTFIRGSGVIISGALHWLVVTSTKSMAIISMDMSDERFTELQLPEEPTGKKQLHTLGEWEECLCLLVSADNNVQFDVWVMQEYGVQDSWSKHFSITLRSVSKYSFVRLMWSFKSGKILFRIGDDLVLYDPKNSNHLTRVSGAKNYVESLVSLNAGTYLGR